jgi:hypothetical protein
MGPDQPEHGLGICAYSRGIVPVALPTTAAEAPRR